MAYSLTNLESNFPFLMHIFLDNVIFTVIKTDSVCDKNSENAIVAQWLIFQSGVSSISLLVWINLNHSKHYITSGSRDHHLLLVKSTFVFVYLILGAFLWTIALFVWWKGSMETNVHILLFLFSLSKFVSGNVSSGTENVTQASTETTLTPEPTEQPSTWVSFVHTHTHTHTHTHPLLIQHIKTPNDCSILSPELVSVFQRRLV